MRTAWGLLLCAAAAYAGDGPFEDGKAAFAEGRYEDAIRAYLEAQQRDGYSPAVLFHLGSAYASSGDVGRAVLSYERALLLAPREGAVREGLEATRKGAGLEGDLDRGWREFHRYLTTGEWTWLGLSAAVALLAVLVFQRKLSRSAIVRLAGTGFLVVLPAATAITKHALDRDRAVVVAATETDIRVSPFEGAEASGKVRPGQVVWITRSFDEFVMVKSPRGAAGWIARSSVEPVMP
ncbi:MAG: hypothetical protein ACHQ1G_01920 [Planctomycetota bacterium]